MSRFQEKYPYNRPNTWEIFIVENFVMLSIGLWDLKGHQFYNFFPYLVQCAIGENELTQNRSAVVLRFLNQQERPQRSHKGYRYNLLTSWYIAFQAQAFSLAKRPDSHFTFHCAATIVYDQRFLRRNWNKKAEIFVTTSSDP